MKITNFFLQYKNISNLILSYFVRVSIPFIVLFQENEIEFQENKIEFQENEIEFQENEIEFQEN